MVTFTQILTELLEERKKLYEQLRGEVCNSKDGAKWRKYQEHTKLIDCCDQLLNDIKTETC